MKRAILVLNSGSSSIKFALYSAQGDDAGPLITGKIAGVGRAPTFKARDGEGRTLVEDGLEDIDPSASHGDLTLRLLDWLEKHNSGIEVVAAGHRVVHGGRSFTQPVVVTPDVLQLLEGYVSLAPLHQPHNLSAIKALAKRLAGLPQVACFDTSFHRTQPRVAELFALPRALADEGVIRYGFHGLSYEYIASVLGDHIGPKAEGRVIVAHLGNGASMCAMQGRRSVATSMGFTALHGLMMGRRCGTLDAGVVLHLVQNKGLSVDDVQHMLYRESGLLGVSGISNNMQVLLESGDERAREAIELYCYRAAGELGSLVMALGGLDAIVFTAGIGENSAYVRRLICERLSWMGVELNASDNDRNAPKITTASSTIDVLVVPTNEELVIAKAVRALDSELASAAS
ncbi:MAG: acetate/propionate family kinase [Alphaproteobacteria bacterium]|nr:acetate/propionate family kinase [Alphaproteobacteria bacterium]